MSQPRVATGLRLTDLNDRDACIARDPETLHGLLAQLTQLGSGQTTILWPDRRPPMAHDTAVLAEARNEDRPLALLCADDRVAAEQKVLVLTATYVAPHARGRRLMQPMLATALLQSARRGVTPLVIAAPMTHPLAFRALRSWARHFPGATLYPDTDPKLVPLATAALARRIAAVIAPRCRFEPATGTLRGGLHEQAAPLAHRLPAHDDAVDAMFADRLAANDQLLAVLDLRNVAEATILETARRLRRGRRLPVSRK